MSELVGHPIEGGLHVLPYGEHTQRSESSLAKGMPLLQAWFQRKFGGGDDAAPDASPQPVAQ